MTNCPNCGAPIKGSRCEYCGTQFHQDYDMRLPQINIIREDRPCDVLGATTIIPRDWIQHGSIPEETEQVSKIAINALSHDLAEALQNYMDLEVEYEPWEQNYKVRSRVRVVRPGYRFY